MMTKKAATKKAATKKAATKKAATPLKQITVVALAKAMGVTPKTIRFLRRNNAGPKANDVAIWAEYLENRSTESGHTQQVADEFMPDEIRRLRAKLLRAQAGKEDVVRKLKELELKSKVENLVPMGEARKAVKRVLAPLRELLDQMPKAAGGKVNPTDPVHGEEGIREHLEGIFKVMEKEFENE